MTRILLACGIGASTGFMAANMRKAAKAEIEREREHAVQQLRTEMITLSMAAAGKIVAKNMDKSENEALIEDFVNKLDKDKIGDLPC